MNKAIFIGRLTKDPVVRDGESVKIANFSLAIDRYSKSEEKQTDFPRITVFGKQAENAEKYLKKGQLVCVEASVRTGQFTNKDGEKVYTTDFIADKVEYLSWESNTEEE
ncbi:MAG: single-stranded DNA-binding protein [[Eubacterium] sulci]|nr:single-stranded DNA-binding protein [[Eubacterium] sulci]